MRKKTAIITGINGMDGSHLADFLLSKDYNVYGLERRNSSKNRTNTKHLEDKIEFLVGDLSDQNSLLRAINLVEPDEIYNLAAQSFVAESWNTPEQTGDITGLGTLRMLEAIRESKKNIKLYQACSSEMFGQLIENPAKETTPFNPRSPYGVAKVYSYFISKNYRESYNMFVSNGILFNHESERRGLEFVTRKITNGVAKIKLGLADKIELGNLDARRDWGYSPDYVEAMWLMLQQETPDDYVVATGKDYSVRDFLNEAFKNINILDWSKYVVQNTKYCRPAEVDILNGDYSKAKKHLGWKPTVCFEEIVSRMVENDIRILEKNEN
jgi:GDPmannose 4,6-dehydratase